MDVLSQVLLGLHVVTSFHFSLMPNCVLVWLARRSNLMLLGLHVEPLGVCLHRGPALSPRSLPVGSMHSNLPILLGLLAIRLMTRIDCVSLRSVTRVPLLLRCPLHGTFVHWVYQRNLAVRGGSTVVIVALRSCIHSVRRQRLLAILRQLVETFDLQLRLLLRLLTRGWHARLDRRARRDEPLLALAQLAVVKAVTSRSTAGVLRVLRHRVL